MTWNPQAAKIVNNLQAKLKAIQEYQKYNQLNFVYTDSGDYSRDKYHKHVEFMNAGKDHRFRLFAGGNGTGKSFCASTEIAYHVTGKYPKWWNGKEMPKITTVWIVAKSGALWRDSMQKTLLGNPGEEVGTGLIPKDSIIEYSSLPGVPGAIGKVLVRHANGQIVSIVIKTSDMNRESLQAANVDLVVFDEEPPEDVYSECVMRLRGNRKKEPGISMLVFTPLKGLTPVILKYLPNGKFPEDGVVPEYPDRYVVQVTWDDAPHLTEEDKQAMMGEIEPHLRDSRTKGNPALGSGRIYPVYEENIVVKPFNIPEYFPRAYALDFGWHKTACLWAAKDPADDCIYLYAEYYRGETINSIHALNIQAKGRWIPGICDPSGGGRNENGKQQSQLYRELGLNLIEGDNDPAWRAEVLNLFETGKLKVFSTLTNFLNELRVYRYSDNEPNKPAPNQQDHLMDCVKYLVSRFGWVAKSLSSMRDKNRDQFRQIKSRNSRDKLTGY